MGFIYEGLPGLRFTGQFQEEIWTVGASLSLGRFGYTQQVRSTPEFDGTATTTHGIRFGAYDRTLSDRYARRGKNYLYLDLGATWGTGGTVFMITPIRYKVSCRQLPMRNGTRPSAGLP